MYTNSRHKISKMQNPNTSLSAQWNLQWHVTTLIWFNESYKNEANLVTLQAIWQYSWQCNVKSFMQDCVSHYVLYTLEYTLAVVNKNWSVASCGLPTSVSRDFPDSDKLAATSAVAGVWEYVMPFLGPIYWLLFVTNKVIWGLPRLGNLLILISVCSMQQTANWHHIFIKITNFKE